MIIIIIINIIILLIIIIIIIIIIVNIIIIIINIIIVIIISLSSSLLNIIILRHEYMNVFIFIFLLDRCQQTAQDPWLLQLLWQHLSAREPQSSPPAESQAQQEVGQAVEEGA